MLAAVAVMYIGIGCKQDELVKPDFQVFTSSSRSVTINESKAYFQGRINHSSLGFTVNQSDWAGLEPVWGAANEVVLNDSSTVVIVPINDSAIVFNPYLDAYVVFFEDSLAQVQMHVLFFQADTTQYAQDSFPSIANFSGLIWEFYDEEDTYFVTVVEEGVISGCGCSSVFTEYIDNIDSTQILPRTKIPKCPRWKDNIWERIGSAAGNIWKGIGGFFRNINLNGGTGSVSGTDSSNGTGGNGGSGTSDLDAFDGFGFGGNGGGGGSSVILNLSSLFTEWQIKQMQKAAIWMNSIYGIDYSLNELYMLMGSDCIIEVGNFVQNPPSIPPIDEEFVGPVCANEFAIAYILELFPQLTEEDHTEIEFLLHNLDDRNKFISYTAGDLAHTENMKGYIKLKNLDSQYKSDRFIELFNLLEDNPNALLIDCFSESEEFDLTFWNTLATFNPPQSVHARIQELGEGWLLQSFITPTMAPRINLDYFSINVSLMPIKNEQTGERWEPADFFDYFRKNLNLFVDTEASEFTPYRYPEIEYDYNLWNSTNPLTSVISVEIPADDGSVICSKSEANNWIFSTLKAPLFPLNEDGFHPVSGNRQFGYKVDENQSITLFIKGADRYFLPPIPNASSTILAYLTEKIAFVGADALWRSFQTKTSAYINSHGGSATVIPAVKNRPKANIALKQLLSSNVEISSQNLCGN